MGRFVKKKIDFLIFLPHPFLKVNTFGGFFFLSWLLPVCTNNDYQLIHSKSDVDLKANNDEECKSNINFKKIIINVKLIIAYQWLSYQLSIRMNNKESPIICSFKLSSLLRILNCN